MEVVKELQSVIGKLDKIDEYYETLTDELSRVDCKIQDLLHYIEFNTIQVKWCYRMVKEIKVLREERRKIKNDMDILSRYVEMKNRLLSVDNRKMVLSEIHKREKQLNSQVYTNREYTNDDINKIIKGGEKVEESSGD